jgi:hypothetical protein
MNPVCQNALSFLMPAGWAGCFSTTGDQILNREGEVFEERVRLWLNVFRMR